LLAQNPQIYRVAGFEVRNQVRAVNPVEHGIAIDMGDDVAAAQTAGGGRAARLHLDNDQRGGWCNAALLGRGSHQLLNLDAEPAAHHMTFADDVLQYLDRGLDRNRKADALGRGLVEHRGVDADQVAVGVDQGTAGVAAVDRRVGLQEVFKGVQAQAAAGGADDALGHRLTETERIADGQHHIADAGLRRAADGHRRQILEGDAQHGEIGLRVRARHGRFGLAAVGQQHDDFVGIRDHMVIGENVTLAAHDHPGAQRTFHALLLRAVALAEIAAKNRIVAQRRLLLRRQLAGVDIHDRRRGALHRGGVGHPLLRERLHSRRSAEYLGSGQRLRLRAERAKLAPQYDSRNRQPREYRPRQKPHQTHRLRLVFLPVRGRYYVMVPPRSPGALVFSRRESRPKPGVPA